MGSSGFFRLPPELRDLVYHYLLEGNIFSFRHELKYEEDSIEATTWASYDSEEPGLSIPRHPTWMQSNSMVKKEAMEQFYRRAVFIVSAVGLPPASWEHHWLEKPTKILTTRLFRGVGGPDIHHARFLKFQNVQGRFPWEMGAILPTLDHRGRAAALLRHLQPEMLELTNLELFVSAGCWTKPFSSRLPCCELAFLNALPQSLRRLKIGVQEWHCGIGDQVKEEQRVFRESKIYAFIVEATRVAVRDLEGNEGKVRNWTECSSWRQGVWWCEGTCAGYKARK